MKLRVLRLLKAIGFFHIARILTRGRTRVLCYHGLWLGGGNFRGDGIFMLPETFRRRLDMVAASGLPVIPLEQAAFGLRNRRPPTAVVITIDDAWRGTYEVMWPELRKRGFPATLYVDTANLLARPPVQHVLDRYSAIIGDSDAVVASRSFEYMTPDQLARAHREGLDVQLHTHNHTMHDFAADAVSSEVATNRAELAGILAGGDLAHFCYPTGYHDPAVKVVLERNGVRTATTCERGLVHPRTDPHFMPRFLDGDNITDIEFEAELCGVLEIMRALRAMVRRRRVQRTDPTPSAAVERPLVPVPTPNSEAVATG